MTVCSSPSCSSLSTHLVEEGCVDDGGDRDRGRAPPSPPVKSASLPRQRILCRPRNRIGMGVFSGAFRNGSPKTAGSPSKTLLFGNTHGSKAHDPLILFGLDLSSQPPAVQFFLCSCGVFAFTIVYGYLQELLAVHIAGRKFALFLAACQFAGYAFGPLCSPRYVPIVTVIGQIAKATPPMALRCARQFVSKAGAGPLVLRRCRFERISVSV